MYHSFSCKHNVSGESQQQMGSALLARDKEADNSEGKIPESLGRLGGGRSKAGC